MFHQQHVESFRAKYNDLFYAIFRVVIGVLFMFHGLQKVFGVFAQNGAQQTLSFMWWVGIVEFLGGLLVALGLLTVLSAVASAIVMIGAYFTAHFSWANPVPIANRGELAVVYLAAFLYIIFEGSGRYSLDAKLCKQCKINSTPLVLKEKKATK
jgi:putative oxidoreductase